MLSNKYAKLTAGILVTGALATWGLLGLPGGALANPPDENGNHNHGGGGGGEAPQYTLIDLGTLGTLETQWGASSVNNLGQVVGRSRNVAYGYRAFLLNPEDNLPEGDPDGDPDTWFADAGTGPDGGSINGLMIDLGTLATSPDQGYWPRSLAMAVNNNGQVTGRSSTDDLTPGGYTVEHGFVIIPEDTDSDGIPDTWFRDTNNDGANDLMIDLGTLATFGDGTSYAYAISDSGYVAGYIPNGANSSAGRAFIVVPEDNLPEGAPDGIPDTWFQDAGAGPHGSSINGLMIDLGGPSSRASAVNDNGWVAGVIAWSAGSFLIIPEDTDNDDIPDTWFRDDEPAPDGDGVNDLMIMLPLPGHATNSSAQAINSLGQVVGNSWKWGQAGSSSNFRAVRWDVDPNTHAVTVTDLGSIKGEKMIFAVGINNTVPPQVVGYARSSPSFPLIPFLWEDGEIYKLLDLISNGAGIEDLWAGDINDSGQIVGGGSLAYIAIPIPPAP